MSFVGFIGLPRTGKTCGMTFWGLCKAELRNLEMVGNYFVDYKRYRRITPFDLLLMLEVGRVDEPVVICTHEVHNWLDSYISMSRRSRGEQSFVTQAMKFNYSWFWDSQRLTKTDSNLRENTPYVFWCEDKGGFFLYTMINPMVRDRVVLTEKKWRLPKVLAKEIWVRYNTFEGSLPLDYAELRCEMEKLMPDVMNDRVEKQVELLLGKKDEFGLGNAKFVSRIAVEDALLCLGEPVAFSAYVANRLKLRLLRV